MPVQPPARQWKCSLTIKNCEAEGSLYYAGFETSVWDGMNLMNMNELAKVTSSYSKLMKANAE